MTVSAHTIEAWIGTQQVDIIDATVTMDEAWNPYVQASITTVLDTDLLDILDPRVNTRVRLFLEQSYGVSDKLSALTAEYNGDQIADVTAVWTGKTIGELSAWYFAPYNPSYGSNKLSRLSSLYGGGTIADITAAWTGLYFWQISEMYSRSYPDGINTNHRRAFDLNLRARTVDLNAGTVALTLASDEALLQDYALVAVNNFSPASLQLRNVIKEVLALTGGYLAEGATDAPVDAGAALWQPGQTAWDYLTPLVQEAGLKLYCDEQRLFHLVEDTFTQPGLAELWSIETIKQLNETIDRENGEWFDAVIVKYTWTDAIGATIINYDTAALPDFTRAQLIEYATNYPGPGAAQRILDRAIARGRQLGVTAVANNAIEPSMACDVYITGYPTYQGYVKAVTWNYPGDEMTVTTRQPVNA